MTQFSNTSPGKSKKKGARKTGGEIIRAGIIAERERIWAGEFAKLP